MCVWFLHFVQPVHYSIQVKRIKTEQRRTIRNRNREIDGKILRLSLAIEKFNHLYDKADCEISLDGDMYDLVSYKRDGDTVRCLVIEDDAESELHKQLNKNIGRKQQRTPKPIGFTWLYVSDQNITLTVAPLSTPLATQTPETSDKTSCGYKRFVSQSPEVIHA